MSGTPPAASTLAFSSRETCGGDCGVAASALAAPLLVPLLGAFLPPNQPMIGDGSCALRRHGVTIRGGGEQWGTTCRPWRNNCSSTRRRRFVASAARVSRGRWGSDCASLYNRRDARACWLFCRNADAPFVLAPLLAFDRRYRRRGSMPGIFCATSHPLASALAGQRYRSGARDAGRKRARRARQPARNDRQPTASARHQANTQ